MTETPAAGDKDNFLKDAEEKIRKVAEDAGLDVKKVADKVTAAAKKASEDGSLDLKKLKEHFEATFKRGTHPMDPGELLPDDE